MNPRDGSLDGFEFSAGFGVEGVLLARASIHPEKNAGLAATSLDDGIGGQRFEPRNRDSGEDTCGREPEIVAAIEEWFVHGRAGWLKGDLADEEELASIHQHPEDIGISFFWFLELGDELSCGC